VAFLEGGDLVVDNVYQLLAHGRWFSPGTPASSTTKTGCHDIAEILLKVALKHQKSINHMYVFIGSVYCSPPLIRSFPLLSGQNLDTCT
jgi:hypothetical protein